MTKERYRPVLSSFSRPPQFKEGYFDYRLKAGPLTTRNAIRLLARLHHPAPVVAAVQALSATLATRAQPNSPHPTTPEAGIAVANWPR